MAAKRIVHWGLMKINLKQKMVFLAMNGITIKALPRMASEVKGYVAQQHPLQSTRTS